jgi:protoporphyrinogen oxidase
MTHKRNKALVVIAGGGPAGLTAAHELTLRTDMNVTVCEASDLLGGISRTVGYKGNRMDIGGHRFFTKSERVQRKWDEIMPMMRRPRVSRIYYLRRFFDYPVSFSLSTVRALGAARILRVSAGYIRSMIHKREERSLEDFYINRFGRPLYRMFFEDYTEKVWGVHPSELGADWGSQRVKGLSISTILNNILRRGKASRRKPSEVETSLIDEFLYPPLGPGQLWEAMGRRARERGAEIEMRTKVKKVHLGPDKRVRAVTVVDAEGSPKRIDCDVFISSMPLGELVEALDGIDVPAEVRRVAGGLPYRDFITVGLLLDRLKINAPDGDRIPDTWIYVQERDVRLGRIQIFNNWSPQLVRDDTNTVWLGLEYFCNEGDDMWEASDGDFIDFAINELESIGIISREDVRDAVRIRMEKAYPAYFGTYHEINKLRSFLDSISNLFCIGRNGQHRYNNMDHSMLTAMKAVDAIIAGATDKADVWNVNTENEYHETK